MQKAMKQVRVGETRQRGSVVLLLLLGTQWYILFNVVAGAMAIPTNLKEATRVFGIEGLERWKRLILPRIFLYSGLSFLGGAWKRLVTVCSITLINSKMGAVQRFPQLRGVVR